jgi:hypothetical protein
MEQNMKVIGPDEFEKFCTGRTFVSTQRLREVIAECNASKEIKVKLLAKLTDRLLLEDDRCCCFQLGLALGAFANECMISGDLDFEYLHKDIGNLDKLPYVDAP